MCFLCLACTNMLRTLEALPDVFPSGSAFGGSKFFWKFGTSTLTKYNTINALGYVISMSICNHGMTFFAELGDDLFFCRNSNFPTSKVPIWQCNLVVRFPTKIPLDYKRKSQEHFSDNTVELQFTAITFVNNRSHIYIT